MIYLEADAAYNLCSKNKIEEAIEHTCECHSKLLQKTGLGNECLGWINLCDKFDKTEFELIKKTARKIINESRVVIVIGIGGSYLGSKAAINAIKGEYYNEIESNTPKIYFAGNDLNSYKYEFYKNLIKNNDTSLIVISKSGTTLEPALGLRILKETLKEKYGDTYNTRIYAITDCNKGTLHNMSIVEQYQAFSVPEDIGGRYSVFTPVGLLPMAVAGLDIDKFYDGLTAATRTYNNTDFDNNPCLKYALARYILYKQGKEIEILVNYNSSFNFISEWWKQLFAESEGKNGKGLFPASMSYTTDLHSLGQMVQDGNKIFFETSIVEENQDISVDIPFSHDDIDGLNYLKDKKLYELNELAYKGTLKAHKDGNVPNIEVRLSKMDEYHLGELFYFFMMSCALSGYMIGVNPFNQPGVEEYKKNIYRLLGK